MKLIIRLFTATLIFLCSHTVLAQHKPVSFDVKLHEDTLVFEADIESGWHLYAANLPDPTGGPLPTEIVYSDPAPILKGKIIEPKGHTEMDDAFGIEVKYFEERTYYKQVLSSAPKTISGTVYYMVCNDEMCIPLEYPFSVSP